jgi:CcmD family protein
MEGQPSGTPFMVAGYLITWAVLGWYVWRLNRRSSTSARIGPGDTSNNRKSGV